MKNSCLPLNSPRADDYFVFHISFNVYIVYHNNESSFEIYTRTCFDKSIEFRCARKSNVFLFSLLRDYRKEIKNDLKKKRESLKNFDENCGANKRAKR